MATRDEIIGAVLAEGERARAEREAAARAAVHAVQAAPPPAAAPSPAPVPAAAQPARRTAADLWKRVTDASNVQRGF